MTISRLTGTSTAEWGFETVKSATWPSGVTTNSIAVLTVTNYLSGGSVTVNTPAGFTKRVDDSFSGNALVVFTLECTGSESGSFNVVLSASGFGSFVFDVYDGTGALTYTSASASDTGTGTDSTAPSVSGTSGQLLLVSYGLSDPPGTTNSGPSGMTIGTSSAFTTNACRSYYQVLASTGATGTKTWDFTNTRDWAGVSILVSEAGGGGPTELPPLVMAQMSPAGRR